jgi:hypothetical protein
MAIELNKRTKILAGVVALFAAGAAAWVFFLEDFLSEPPPAPKAAVPAPAKQAADATPKQAAAPAAKPAPKPAPGSPEKLVAEVIDASGIKTQFQAYSRDVLVRAVLGEAPRVNPDPADVKALTDMVDRAFEPGALAAELAASLKTGLDAERMERFLEILRQPIVMKMHGAEARKLTPAAIQEYFEAGRKNPPSAARVKLIQAVDDVTLESESMAEHATAIIRDMYDTAFAGLQKAGKSVPKEAREELASRVNTARNQIRAHSRSMLYSSLRGASDQELADYVKLIDTDTGRWGMAQLANAAKPALVSRGSALGKESAQLALARRPAAVAKAPEPAPEPLAKASTTAPAAPAAPVAAPAPAAAPAEPVGYQRPSNIRELYPRYNDVVTATVMRDPAAVKQLLDDGKSPNVRQSNGMTPLMIAAGNGDTAIAGMLLASGADPNLRAMGRTTALSIARSRGAAGADLVQMLQRSGAKE